MFIDDAGNPVIFPGKRRYLAVLQQAAALVFNLGRHGFPQLSGAEFGIDKFLNQRGLHLSIFGFRKDFRTHVLDDRGNRQPLYPLRAPFGGNIPRMPSPQLFRVSFEKHAVQHPAKPVYVKVLQGIFRQLAKQGMQIAEASFDCLPEPHIPKCLGFHADRIIEKMLLIINAGYPLPNQHDPVFLLRVRAGIGQ